MKRGIPVHPFLFSFFFIAIPLVDNINEMLPALMIRSYLAAILINLFFLGAAWLITRNLQHSAFLCSLLWICIGLSSLPYLTGFGAALLPAEGVLCILLVLCLALLTLFGRRDFWRRIKQPARITGLLNGIGLASILYSVFVLVNYTVQQERWKGEQARWVHANLPAEIPGAVIRPDVYYIVLDGYARGDVLRDLYGVENEPFLDELRNMGFYVAGESSSNYMQTVLSLASSLNLNYLDQRIQEWGVYSGDRKIPAEMVQHSLARAFLEGLGYRTVNIVSDYFPVDIPDADERVSADPPYALNVFEQFWIKYSAFQALIPKDESGYPVWDYAAHRGRIVSGFDGLVRVSEESGPKFVFAHIFAPHPPFVLREDGSAVQPDRPYLIHDGDRYSGTREEYVSGYSDQLRYINRRLLETIPKILENSSGPVVIILQSDHGPGSRLNWLSAEASCLWERTSILNAYYLPEEYRAELYPSITPVNTFRLIFREVFQADYPPLEDAAYYSTWAAPYQLLKVDGPLAQPCDS